MDPSRPPQVGIYEILQDFECPAASVRVFRVHSGEAVLEHVHRRSMQIYVALEGEALVDCDGVETRIHPYETVTVWPGTIHGVHAATGTAVVMNISVPPLGNDDQVAASSARPTSSAEVPLPPTVSS